MGDEFSIDTAQLRSAGKDLEASGNEITNLHNTWLSLISEAKSALGNDSNGRKMAESLGNNSEGTGAALKSYGLAVRGGGQAFQSAADVFVETEDANTAAAKDLSGSIGSSTNGVGTVSTGDTSSSSSSSSSSTSSSTHGRH